MKIIEIDADAGHLDTLRELAEAEQVRILWTDVDTEQRRATLRLLVGADKRQQVLDSVMRVLGGAEDATVLVLPVEAMLPRPAPEEGANPGGIWSPAISREELYEGIEKGARLDANFLLLVVLSTVVAAIGLVEDNVAVVIGAMVIAPLLGPNLALALATSLADLRLMGLALKTNLLGLSLAVLLPAAMAWAWPVPLDSQELGARTVVGLDSIALALASGAAAVLSLTTGLPTVLVGVMVAVALLPPAATCGLMLGAGEYPQATAAGLLLAVNVVCVNLSAKVIFLIQGVKPRGWAEKRKARRTMAVYLLLWILTLAILTVLILLRRPLA